MSHIDQAFINAYADEPTVAQTASLRNSATPRTTVEAPQLRVFAHGTDRTAQARFEQPEPTVTMRRPPHFAAPATDPYSAIATEQQVQFSNYQETPSEELTLPSLVGERRPLSSFATPRPAPSAAFKPVFEVDEFRWPKIVDELFHSSKNLLLPVVELLLASAREGRSLVGIAGSNTGVGASTTTMCLARLIAAAGHSMALVDANFTRGNLASTLGLEFDTGWEDVLAGQIPLAECAVMSLADKLTLVPLGGPATAESERLTSIQSSVIAGMLRYHHELVLFDLGAASEKSQLAAIQNTIEHCRLDAGIIIAPSGASDPVTVHGIDQLGKLFGPLCLGVIGNRAS
ncbi:MAG: cellulose synthase operon protein YhjQ/BcsQ [Bythopirellula sp.]|nr:cellulose synthase operon protein YhjQ/BcsQ [Bythopirellula sp.]